MKNYLLVLILTFCFLRTDAQIVKHKRFIDDLHGMVGASAGFENLIGLPKLGLCKEFNIGHQYSRFGFSRYAFYTGADVSMFILFAGTFSASVNSGVAIGPFTLETSLTSTVVCDSDGNTAWAYRTVNSKFGLRLGPVWLKAGPSWLIGGDTEIKQFFKINRTHYSVEIFYVYLDDNKTMKKNRTGHRRRRR